MINLARVKKLLKFCPEELLFPLKYLPFSVFCGAAYRYQYAELKEQLELDRCAVERIRNKKLLCYLNESIKHTRFYSDFAKAQKITNVTSIEQLFEFPLISKEQLQDDLEWFLDERYSDRRYKVTTGGTTGQQTELYLSNSCYSKEWAFVNSYLERNGVDCNSHRLCLRGVAGKSDNSLIGHNPLYKELLVSPFHINEDSVMRSIKKIKSYKPKFIHGYPSTTKELATILLKNKICIDSVDAVLLVSEKLYGEQAEIIKNCFDAKILSFYGMTERVIFATYNDGHFLPNPYYGIVEEHENELIGTGFVNSATRLIRYRTGDLASVKKCGNFVTEISSFDGRWGKEFLLGATGVKISMTALNVHSDELKRVIRYQFFQSKIGVCELRMMVANDFSASDLKKVQGVFQRKVGKELKIDVKVVTDIPLSKRGKHQFIQSTL